jgi:alpha-tubulin suppressor-like RCC1 family protein
VQGAVDVQGLKGSVVSLVAGVSKSCALLSTGGAMCWGSNTTGALGDGSDAVERAAPVDVVGLGSAAVDIGGTGHHTCALTVESTVKCWGNNANGELGRTDVLYSNVPVDVVGF